MTVRCYDYWQRGRLSLTLCLPILGDYVLPSSYLKFYVRDKERSDYLSTCTPLELSVKRWENQGFSSWLMTRRYVASGREGRLPGCLAGDFLINYYLSVESGWGHLTSISPPGLPVWWKYREIGGPPSLSPEWSVEEGRDLGFPEA